MNLLYVLKERAPTFIELAWRSPASPTAPSGRDAATLRSVSNRKVTIRTYFPRISRPRDSRITRSPPTETRRWPSANYRGRTIQKESRSESGRGPMVVAQHSAEALSPSDSVMGWGADGCGPRKSVFQALMIALGMIVRHELPDCVLKRCQSEEGHPAQTLLFS